MVFWRITDVHDDRMSLFARAFGGFFTLPLSRVHEKDFVNLLLTLNLLICLLTPKYSILSSSNDKIEYVSYEIMIAKASGASYIIADYNHTTWARHSTMSKSDDFPIVER